LLIYIPISLYLSFEVQRKSVHHRAADTVQASGDLVGAAAEFTAGVQGSHYGLQARLAGGRVNINRNTSAIIGYGNQSIFIQGYIYTVTIPGHRFVHRVVQDLVNEVLQSSLIGAANVHPWPHPDRFQTLQDPDVFRGIPGRYLLLHRLFHPRELRLPSFLEAKKRERRG
jgi:hypothetical protein